MPISTYPGQDKLTGELQQASGDLKADISVRRYRPDRQHVRRNYDDSDAKVYGWRPWPLWMAVGFHPWYFLHRITRVLI